MTQVSEITAQEYTPEELAKESTFARGVAIAKLALKNPSALKKVIVMSPDEPRYVRPPREYDLPAYRQGMKYCTSNEKYLRPTRWCNPREPLIIAMANELGSYELSDREFAEAAYWFVKTKLGPEFLPMDGASTTLKRGTGTCMHLISVWIALCRAAGIKARYKMFKTIMNDIVTDLDLTQMVDLKEADQEMLPGILSMATPHGEGEVCIDGKWVVADVSMEPEMLAYAGVPITRFGEDAIGLVWKLVPGTVECFESLPWKLGITMKAGMRLAHVVMERSSIAFEATRPEGRRIIEEAGGMDAYDQRARRKRELVPTEQITQEIARLTKDAERRQDIVFEE